MKKRSPKIGFLSSHGVVGLLLCATCVCSLAGATQPASSRTEALQKILQRTLTFAERVSYQRAIEEVYWRYRIWPKDRSDPKPSLDAVMPQEQLEKKVAGYLRDSEVLQGSRHGPITAEQLQAELERMARHTKQPDVLRELFGAVGNDPFAAAECLARPVLAERLIADGSAQDETGRSGLRTAAGCVACRWTHSYQTRRTPFQGLPKEILHVSMIPGQPPAPPTHRLTERTTSQYGLALK